MVVATETLRPLTIEDLAEFPDDNVHREIVTGELIESPVSTPAHQMVVGRLLLLIGNFADTNVHGQVLIAPVDVRLSPHDIVKPDILLVPVERTWLLKGDFIDGAPELVIEVMSPPTVRTDLIRKRALYAKAGIAEYWIVDPVMQTIVIHKLEGGMYMPVASTPSNPKSLVLDGLEIDLAKLFEDVPLQR